MGKRPVCAYCGGEGDLTNEHVFPHCFQKAFEAITPAKTPFGEKAILGALLVGDVCAPCNNERLSSLDAYLCELNDVYFSRIVRPGDCVRFRYDFDLLLRVLLKIGYNVARARKGSLEPWNGATSYILGRSPCPAGLHLLLQLMIPTPIGKTNRPVSPGTTEVPPWPMSVYTIDVSNFHGLRSVYWISIWSYRFFVLQENMEASRSARRRTLARGLKNTTGAYELTRRGFATIYSSSVEVLDAVKNSPIFDEQLDQARKLKAATDLNRQMQDT
jgi:hypothetical protein